MEIHLFIKSMSSSFLDVEDVYRQILVIPVSSALRIKVVFLRREELKQKKVKI